MSLSVFLLLPPASLRFLPPRARLVNHRRYGGTRGRSISVVRDGFLAASLWESIENSRRSIGSTLRLFVALVFVVALGWEVAVPRDRTPP